MYRPLLYRSVTVASQPFEDMLNQLLTELKCTYTPMRLVLFTHIRSNDQYTEYLSLITKGVARTFGDKAPVVSLVAQETLDGVGLAAEVHEMKILADETLEYKRWEETPYITLQCGSVKRLFLGGVISKDLHQSIATQSAEVFYTIKAIMEQEQMPTSSIVRQWNYIEKITDNNNGRQNYQVFNDARSIYYDLSEWPNGFPAATGIGTDWGGIMIDLNATLAYDDHTLIKPVDNPLQVAAHAYSQTQLLGDIDKELTHKTTPKFERAKSVTQRGSGVLYVSGTAAIRGELSLKEVGIEEQTRITIENINVLTGNNPLELIRIYLKNIEELETAKAIVSKLYPNVAAIYLQADVCREELLIEIEGVSIITEH